MKILHVLANISPSYGGTSKACTEMCRALASAGEEITIYTSNMDYPKGRLNVAVNTPIADDGYNVWHFPVQFPPYMISVEMAKALRDHVKEFNLVHIHGLYRFPQAVAAHYARRHDVPYIVQPHGVLDPFLFYGRRPIRKRVYEYMVELRNLNSAGAIQFTSEEEMNLAQPLGLRVPSIVVPLGLELSEYENLPRCGTFKDKYGLGDTKVILHMGRINFKKGLDILVRAFAQVAIPKEDIRLVLAGPDDGYGRQVSELLMQEGIEDKALFTSMLQGDDKLAALKDADIFALPSYSENFGVAVIEAMACGVPVVISNKVNIWREVQAGGAGLVTPCDAQKVAEAMLFLLNDEDSRRKMGRAGRALVRENYGWDSVVRDMLAAYQARVRKNTKR